MEKCIPYEKRSDKEKRRADQSRRKIRGGRDPLRGNLKTARPAIEKKARNWKRDDREPIPGCFYI